jgi:hypothetical protein
MKLALDKISDFDATMGGTEILAPIVDVLS